MAKSLIALGALLLVAVCAPAEVLPEYTVHRATEPIEIDGRMTEPSWQNARPVGAFVFPWWTAGEKEPTDARMLWDDANLYVCFIAQDRHITATLTERDGPVSLDDCVEVFVAPEPANVKAYFNFEINALGTLLDRSPRNNRSKHWNAEGVQIAITCDGTRNDESDVDRSWTTEIAIPFLNFEGVATNLPPKDGDLWRLNLYRIGGRINAQFSVWSDTRTEKPSFHVPERFGVARFAMSPAKKPTGSKAE